MSVTPPPPPKKWEHMSPRERAMALVAAERRTALDALALEGLARKMRRRHEMATLARNAGPFLDEFEVLCRKHGVMIDHEDSHGSFLLVAYRVGGLDRLRECVALALHADADDETSPTVAPPLEGGPW